MRRLSAYVAGSVTLATAVVTYAILERPNFYSAAVWLSQSNACLMILCNFALVLAATIMYTLQHFLFGPLRPLETEQLWERSWFAMMEWVFAMSTFRDEFGVWFLVMFTSLFAGKIWGWIAEGRVEQLEQQQPNDTRLLHPRLLTSLAIYVGFAAFMFDHCLDVVVFEARPGMTIMFVFEFAILCVSAVTACARYAIWAQEHRITRQQVVQAVEARKVEIRKQRKEAEEKIKAAPEAEDAPKMEDLPREEDVDENEVEAAGWEAKRGWIFALDIVSDLLKLIAYMAFFTILTVFYGIPIYIIRDLYMTMRSFTKRVSDYLRFQAATRDMDTRYPNATAQDLEADNTCIVCREEMRPFDAEAAAAPGGQPMLQRHKPKKLPCGHILHFGCLSSWLERQQACPICRRSVFNTGAATAGTAGQPQAGAAGQPGAAGPNQNLLPRPNPQQPRNEARVYRLGPLRLQIGGALPGRVNNDQELLNALGRLARQNIQRREQQQANANANANTVSGVAGAAPANGATTDVAANSVADPANSDIHPGIRSAAARMALNTVEQQIQREIQALNVQGQRANALRNLLNELDRARNVPVAPPRQPQRAAVTPGALFLQGFGSQAITPSYFGPGPSGLQYNQQTLPFARAPDGPTNTAPPPGVVVPQGWTLVPLNPLPDAPQAPPQILQTLLQAQRPNGDLSTRTPSTHVPLNQTNPLAQFFANAVANGHVHPSESTPHVGSPFPPPPHPQTTSNGTPASATSTNGATASPASPNTGSNEITPTATNATPGHERPSAAFPLPGVPDRDVAPPPTAITPTWSFPTATAAASNANEAPTSVPEGEMGSVNGSGKGKAPAVQTGSSVPKTHVEPPTPVDGPVHENGGVNGGVGAGKQASVEDAEGEDEDV